MRAPDLPTVAIRGERPDDVAAIRTVVELAFGRPDEAALVDALREAGRVVLSLVAELDGRVVGHVLFSPVTIETDAATHDALGLAPLAVLPEVQRRGVGAQLIEAGLAECRRAGHERVVVLGNPDYYPRFGFEPAGRHGLRCAFDAPDEAFMALELRPGALAGCAGTARYAPELDAF